MKFRCIIVCFAAMFISGIAFGDEIIYSQNFDALDDGDIAGQDGWTVTQGQASTTIQSDVAFEGKAMMTEPNQEVAIMWDIVESGTCYLSIFFRKEDDDPANTLHFYMGRGATAWSAGPVIRIGAQSGDPAMIGIHDGDDIVQAEPFVIEKWHHLREVIDVDNLTFEVYLDGDSLGTFNFRNPDHDAIEWLMVGFDGGVDILGYYDNLEFGLGKGEGAYIRATPVEAAGKLGASWGAVKKGY